MNKEEKTMNIEEEIKQAAHEESVKYWAERATQLNIYNEKMKYELENPEPSRWRISGRLLDGVCSLLTERGTIPEEVAWEAFLNAMPKLAKELKENYDNLKAKVPEMIEKEEEMLEREGMLPWYKRDRREQARKQARKAERQARKAKLPWYRRWFA